MQSPLLYPTRVSVLRLRNRIACFSSTYQIDSARQRKVKGTGLGLALSKQLAELLGGAIYLKSESRSGFTVYGPAAPPGSGAVPSRNRPDKDRICAVLIAKPARSSRYLVYLVIDDEDVSRYLVTKLLSGCRPKYCEAQRRIGRSAVRA